MFSLKVFSEHSEIVEEPVDAGEASRPSEGDGGGELQDVPFSSGNPRVESARGIAHLFRNTSEIPGDANVLPVGGWDKLLSRPWQGSREPLMAAAGPAFQ